MKERLYMLSSTLLGATAVAAMLVATAHAGDITGTISLNGKAPTRRQVKMSADPQCEAANPDGRLGDVFVINDGKVQNVFVYVKEGLGDKKFETPKEPAKINQHGCMYTPHVVGAMAGQTLEILNSDGTLHNVHSLPKNSKQFNSAMPMKGMKIKKKFASPEIMVRMKCDVHPWMSAYVGVLDHPFFAVSGSDGSYTIKGLPAGTYTIEAWHEKMGTQTQSVTVGDSGAASADFAFSPGG